MGGQSERDQYLCGEVVVVVELPHFFSSACNLLEKPASAINHEITNEFSVAIVIIPSQLTESLQRMNHTEGEFTFQLPLCGREWIR